MAGKRIDYKKAEEPSSGGSFQRLYGAQEPKRDGTHKSMQLALGDRAEIVIYGKGIQV